jgi:uncharacterized membrane protein
VSVLMSSRARLFVLVGKLTTAQAAETFLKWRQKVISTSLNENGAFIAKIRRDGVFMWLREEEWRRSRR